MISAGGNVWWSTLSSASPMNGAALCAGITAVTVREELTIVLTATAKIDLLE